MNVDAPLDAVSVRVLGSLIEKEITTPDYYPLTLNALVTACNQTSNRDPVMELTEDAVRKSINDLRVRALARGVQRMDSRVMRYSHLLTEKLSLSPQELAVMGVLMLRGPQTAGEIRTHSKRLFDFAEVPQVEHTLDGLASRNPPLVAQMPRRAGQKEARFGHLLAGELPAEAPEAPESAGGTRGTSRADEGRLQAMEQSIATLRAEVAELRAQLESFRRQFE